MSDELRKLLLARAAGGRHPGARRHRGRRAGAARDPGAAPRDRRARPPQGRLRAQPHRARPGDRARARARARADRSCCASPCCCTTSASRRRARSSRAGWSPSTTTTCSAAKLAAKRLRELRFDNDTVKAVAELIRLHLRFFGYAEGKWTDSAVRRYVRDAGDLLEWLHILSRADVTTRNQRKASTLATAYDELEARIAALGEEEELAAIRPDLDGEQIMAILGLKPGPRGRRGVPVPARAAAGRGRARLRHRARPPARVVGDSRLAAASGSLSRLPARPRRRWAQSNTLLLQIVCSRSRPEEVGE